VFRAVALKVLEVCAIPTPWLHQDTTTIALYGASEDEPQTSGASLPAYGGLFIHQKKARYIAVYRVWHTALGLATEIYLTVEALIFVQEAKTGPQH
jgi:hypothetical protein